MKALIVYHTKTGHTHQAAQDIARGLSGGGVECDIKTGGEVASWGRDEVAPYDIVLVGTPTYGNRRYQLPAKPVERFMNALSPGGLEGKTAGAFTAYAGYGGEKLIGAVESSLEGLGATVAKGGPAVKAGAPLSLWKGPDAKPDDVKKCEEFGRRLASL